MPSDLEPRNNEITELMIAASRGDAARVDGLLSGGTDVNARDRFGYTALLYAASGGHLKIVEALIEAGADVRAKNQNNMSAFDLARAKGFAAVAELLRETRFFIAARDGDLITLGELLDGGVDPNTLLRNEWTALMIAALNDRPQAVTALLRRGAYADARNADGYTALMIAEMKGFDKVAQLLRHGAPDRPPSRLLAPELAAPEDLEPQGGGGPHPPEKERRD